MKKLFLLLLLLLPSIVFANPKSIHYSALGDYLVDQNGERTTIKGHPQMICYVGYDEAIHGTYQKTVVVHPGIVIYMVGWSEMDYQETGERKKRYFGIPNPVCDLQ